MKPVKSVQDLAQLKEAALEKFKQRRAKAILVRMGTCGIMAGAKDTMEAIKAELAKRNASDTVVLQAACSGQCELEPLVVVYPEEVTYVRVRAEDAAELVDSFLNNKLAESLMYKDPETDQPIPQDKDYPFMAKQVKVAMRNAGKINPEDIEEYIARDGFAALSKALNQMTREQVVDEVKKSGLRGRGGAGFSTGMKWQFTYQAKGDKKYVVCNGDEGDPGAYMDRSVLEGDPFSVIEAMTIAGYAIGSDEGYFYVRAEYPLAVKTLNDAIQLAESYGLLGDNIMGTDFSFKLRVRMGAGAFVCGEETALLASIEGKRGEPRPRPPFPANEGLWAKPTLLNNVETYANICPIIINGGEWFAKMGTEGSKGTKVFSLTGKVKNTGLIEVPMGIPLGEIVYDIGGGMANPNKKFKAAQTGGPSGGCIPASHLNTGVDYESLAALGTIVGSGGLIVMDEDTCMVGIAKFFIEFCQEESCGKCVPCRIGTKRMLEILDRITGGQGKEGDIETLQKLGAYVKNTSLCGLGQSAPNPILSTIRYFRDEYESHIRDKYCVASACAAMFESPCQNTCPAGIDVPLYVDHIKNGRFLDSYLEVMRENPFPGVCGRVCNHPCEGKCRRAQMEDPIAIRTLKRSASDWVLKQNNGAYPVTKPTASTGKQVAVIGAGPSGLTAAYYLARKGHSVTVFEALPEAGGMLKYGIPDYRLPADVLAADIKAIEDLGVTIKLNTKLGKDVSFEDLKAQGFEVVYVAIGAQDEQKLGVPGEDLNGVISGIGFLKDIKLGTAPDLNGKTVLVIGGGNVAIDSARTAVRAGAKEVHVVYRRRKEDMPAFTEEIEEAEHEGVKYTFMAAPVKVVGDGQVSGLECQKSAQGEFDNSGRRKPIPIADSNFVISGDVIISAIGQVVATDTVKGTDVKVNRGLISADKNMGTNVPYIFAGGDCVTGPDTAINAIAQGKQAAASIDKYLGGSGVVVEPRTLNRAISGELVLDKQARAKEAALSLADRKGFDEVEKGFTQEQAIAEASRCLRCDVK
ncbi:MAG: FAD-dependent oxidoreductase [Firmicutes bacterium]|nr:FAD-dependent oxidoreductase [Bacillota bacterium]